MDHQLHTEEIIERARLLPVDEQLFIIDSLLKGIHASDSEISRAWCDVAQRRLDDIRSEKMEPISGEEVFKRIWRSFKE